MLDRSKPIPREIADRAAALPDAQWRRFVSRISDVLIELEREAAGEALRRGDRPATRGLGEVAR